MENKPHKDSQILKSWNKNALVWNKAIENGEIESRKLVTNRAILESIYMLNPVSVLDLGCGEGWLTRALMGKGIQTIGVDGVDELIKIAKARGNGKFVHITYEDLHETSFDPVFDVVVCNFSLIGKESTANVVKMSHRYLRPKKGKLIIQTLHPDHSQYAGEQDGWKNGSWDGFNDEFTDPAPWFFRNLESWKKLILKSGFTRLEMVEPSHPDSGEINSLIIIAHY